MSSRRFEGKTVLITGASSGVGRAAALAFAREGAAVAVCSRRAREGEETAAAARALGAEAIWLECDVAREEAVARTVETVVERFGRLDCAVNNASVIGPTGVPLTELTERDWDSVLGIDLKGTWLCVKHQALQMKRQGGGAIVNAGSTTSLVANSNGTTAYVCAKHGVAGLTRVAAVELGPSKIRVNAVAIGAVDTEMFEHAIPDPERRAHVKRQWAASRPLRRLAAPEEIAAAYVWLCSGEASYMTGAVVNVDGGRLAGT